MLRVKRPIDVVVLNCCVTETKDAPLRIEDLDDLGKISQRAGEPVDLVDNDRIDPTRRDVGEQPLQSRPIDRRAGEPAVVITCAQANPALVPLAGDEGLTSFALRLQRIELLLKPLLGGFAGVDRTADGSAPPRSHWLGQWLASARSEPRARLATPKNRGPDQCVPVIRSAITVSDR